MNNQSEDKTEEVKQGSAVKVSLLPHQLNFLKSKHKFTLLLGGLGSGKSYAGAHYVIKQISENPEARGFIGANSYGQLMKSTLNCLFGILTELKIPFSHNMHNGILKIFETTIITATMDNYDIHRGIEIGWAWLDEARDMKKEAFEVIMGRLRDKKSKSYEVRLTSTPKGFNWLYDYFSGDKKTDEYFLVNAKTSDNRFLPSDYIQTLEDSYSDSLYKQEILGQFINISAGAIYYAFNRNRNLRKVKLHRDLPIWIGMDFNVDPMTAVLANVTDHGITVFDEIYLSDSNTFEMAKVIRQKIGSAHATIVPDYSGVARKTSANYSDHEILRQSGFKVHASVNPFRLDRYNAVNLMLNDSSLLIDAEKCPKLIKDLEQLTYKDGTSMPDTSDKTMGHISDALGYLVFKTHGIRRPQSSRTIQL